MPGRMSRKARARHQARPLSSLAVWSDGKPWAKQTLWTRTKKPGPQMDTSAQKGGHQIEAQKTATPTRDARVLHLSRQPSHFLVIDLRPTFSCFPGGLDTAPGDRPFPIPDRPCLPSPRDLSSSGPSAVPRRMGGMFVCALSLPGDSEERGR